MYRKEAIIGDVLFCICLKNYTEFIDFVKKFSKTDITMNGLDYVKQIFEIYSVLKKCFDSTNFIYSSVYKNEYENYNEIIENFSKIEKSIEKIYKEINKMHLNMTSNKIVKELIYETSELYNLYNKINSDCID